MHGEKENLADLIKARKGLLVLLMAAAMIALLAALAPHAWATPDQKPLAQTVPDVDGNPDPPDCVNACDGPIILETQDDGFEGANLTDVPVYVTENTGWTAGMTPGDPGMVVVHTTTVDLVDGHFSDPPRPPGQALIWGAPTPGYYDIWFDLNYNGVFDAGDGILGEEGPVVGEPWVGAYICVEPCPVGGATLPAGGGLSPVWFALGALVAVGAGAAVVWSRRRA